MACLPAIDPNDIRKTLVNRLYKIARQNIFQKKFSFNIGHFSVGNIHSNLSAFFRLLGCDGTTY